MHTMLFDYEEIKWNSEENGSMFVVQRLIAKHVKYALKMCVFMCFFYIMFNLSFFFYSSELHCCFRIEMCAICACGEFSTASNAINASFNSK